MIIDSIKDPRVIKARELSAAKGRIEHSALLLEGEEHIEWGLQAELIIETVFIHDKLKEHPLIKILSQKNIPYFFTSEGILKKISDTNYLIPYIGVAHNPPVPSSVSPEFAVVLDNVVDYGNIGTIVRSGLAFGIDSFITTNTTTDFFYKKIIDASRGNVFRAHVQKFSSDQETIAYLKKQGFYIITTSPYAKHIQSLTTLPDQPIALVLGNETNGCSQHFIDQADLLIQIPMNSQIESLNVAVAAGISMYELKIKMVIAMLIQKIYKNVGRQFGVTAQLIRQAFNTELSKVTHFSAMHVILLMILKCDSTMTLDQVTKDTGEFGDELETFLNPLSQDSYIERTISEEKPSITLTRSGEEFIAKLWPIVTKTEDKILENFSEFEKTQLTEYITRIHNNCTKIIAS